MKSVFKRAMTAILTGACFSFGLSGAPTQAQTAVTPLVVYHFDDAQAQGLKGLRSIRNQLDTVPATKLAIVAHADALICLWRAQLTWRAILPMPHSLPILSHAGLMFMSVS